MPKAILILLITSLACFAQAPRRTNLIVLSCKDSINIAYGTVIEKLEENGYAIEVADSNRFMITTCPKVIEDAITININVLLTPRGEILLTGNTFIHNVGVTPIENVGMKGSPANLGFEELDRVGRVLGKRICYKGF